MSEPDGLVARITISPENLERWFGSAIPALRTWDEDWQAWWDVRRERMYSPSDRWDVRVTNPPGTVREVVDQLVETREGTFGQTWYDASTGVWRFLAIEVSQNYGEMIERLAPFRAAERFSECDEDDYVAFTPYFYVEDARRSVAALKFAAGRSTMLLDDALPERLARDIACQFSQAERDRVILPYRYPDGSPPYGTPQAPLDG